MKFIASLFHQLLFFMLFLPFTLCAQECGFSQTQADSGNYITNVNLLNVGIYTASLVARYHSDDVATIKTLGFCYGIRPNPNTANSRTIEQPAMGVFKGSIRNLLPGTVYYIRPYIIDHKGICYGKIFRFKTHEIDAVIDADGNFYDTVKIGNQVWFAEDLRTTRYNDGACIKNITDNKSWTLEKSGAWCWYGNDSTLYTYPRGKLYNWYTVNSNKICPSGWHVPEDEEWRTLQDFLGGEKISGGKLKAKGIDFWKSPNIQATNTSRFSAIPSGYRNAKGMFLYSTIFENWWSKDPLPPDGASYWYVYYATGLFYQSCALKMMGHSIRCIQD